jgi:hypothetical protein
LEVLAELILTVLVTVGGIASFLLPFETAGKELKETAGELKPGTSPATRSYPRPSY